VPGGRPLSLIAARIGEARQRVASACRRVGREPGDVHIMAVGKTQAAGLVAEAVGLVEAFGENRVQEAMAKRPLVPGDTPWHLIGPLQRNKARLALDTFDCIQTVDRIELATRLEQLLAESGRRLPVLVEVNVGAEPQKSGALPAELPRLLDEVRGRCPHLSLRGLMAIPPWSADPEASRPYFARLRELREACLADLGGRAAELSMGMSDDFEVAVEEGATWVRLGRVLFGERRGA
jgi:PLP dependent protein